MLPARCQGLDSRQVSPSESRCSPEQRKPCRQTVQEQPISPDETSQAIAPNDLIAEEDEHHHHHKYPMNQDTIGAVAGVLGLLVHFARSKGQDGNSQACENESNANV